MANEQITIANQPKSLRLWPGITAVVLLCLLKFGVPILFPDAMTIGFLGSLICSILVILWWLLFSRAPWIERISAIVLMAAALYLTMRLADLSIRGGAMGFLLYVLAVPYLCIAFVAWAAVSRRLAPTVRVVTMAAVILISCGAWTLVRTGGFTAGGKNDLHWRWTPTPEQRLLAESRDLPPPPVAAAVPVAAKPNPEPVTTTTSPTSPPAVAPSIPRPEWPGFRGPERDGIITGTHIKTDWAATPPSKIWQKPIGPGWSSFAVAGDRFYTQEQRGEEEVVSCYKLSTGEPVWMHKDAARFYESNGGAGPRATPTLSNGRVYTLGATGIVNVLDAATGARIWSRNAASETGAKLPGWGFAGSPLVLKDLVIVAVSGTLIAYDRESGAKRWAERLGGSSYSSPHLMTIGGVEQVVLMSGAGAAGVLAGDGKILWQYAWVGNPIVQPLQTDDGDLLVTTVSDASGPTGTRRLKVAHSGGTWTVAERWNTNSLKPYFSHFVVHKGHAYGFDGSILACIDLEEGKRKWKGGRYGNGQFILLADQDLMLVAAEEGDLALVKAIPDQFTELARIPAIEGKTWNHPVVVGDKLLVRNAEQMAAFRLTLDGR